jgi:hypothetical protein
MTKNTKTLLMIGGVAVVGYLLWKKYGKGMMSSSSTTTTTKTGATSSFTGSDDFFNASGRLYSRTRSGDETPNCPSCSKAGECWSTVPRTDTTIAAGIAGQRSLTTCTPSSSTTVASRR